MIPSPTINNEVVQEHLHERRNKFSENLHDDPLKGCRCRFKCEHHNYGNKYSPFGNKNGFLLFVGVHPDLIIADEPVQETVNFVTGDGIQDSIRKWEWKGVCFRCCIQLPVVNSDPYLTVLFRVYHYQT